jgi:CBS domain-containing protein
MPATTDQATVTVRDIMITDVATTTPDVPVTAFAHELVNRGLSGMPVLDADGALIGMASEYDVISKRGRTVGEIMSRGVITVDEETSVESVAGLMGLHGIRRVPVVRAGRLVGIVARTDLLRLFTTTHWVCATCGHTEAGFIHPLRCPACGKATFRLERAGHR